MRKGCHTSDTSRCHYVLFTTSFELPVANQQHSAPHSLERRHDFHPLSSFSLQHAGVSPCRRSSDHRWQFCGACCRVQRDMDNRILFTTMCAVSQVEMEPTCTTRLASGMNALRPFGGLGSDGRVAKYAHYHTVYCTHSSPQAGAFICLSKGRVSNGTHTSRRKRNLNNVMLGRMLCLR